MLKKIGVLLLLFNLSWASFAQKNLTSDDVFSLLATSDSLLLKSEFSQSLILAKKALEQAYEIEDPYMIALAYNTIAGNMEEVFEDDKAIAYYQKAQEYAAHVKDDLLDIWLQNNIGNVYLFKKDEIGKALEYYQKSLTISEKIEDKSSQVLVRANIAWAYFKNSDFDSAIFHLSYVEKHIEELDIPEAYLYLNLLQGKKFAYLNDHNKAEEHFKRAIELGSDGTMNKSLVDAYDAYSTYLFDIKNYKDAYLNREFHKKTLDLVYNTEKIKNAQLAGFKIELDEYKREIDKIELEKLLQEKSLKNSKIIVALFLVVLFVLLLLLFTLHRNNKFKKAVNEFLKRKNRELEDARVKAEELSKLKTQFISTISHELRTPLYGVVGITDILADKHQNLKDSDDLKSLKFSARYLLSLVNNLLQINQIEEKNVVLESTSFNLEEEMKLVENSLSSIATRNNNKIKLEIDPKLPELLVGDKLRLAQIMMNLVSNALKFTQNGMVMIRVNLVSETLEECTVQFEVEDTGRGIPEENLNSIFDKFTQIDRSVQDYQGTGLGLSIVKKLVELFKGNIRVNSVLGKGTVFTFEIQFLKNHKLVNEGTGEELESNFSGHDYSVLIVEDNKINQMVTEKILKKYGFSVVMVDNGFEALKELDNLLFDVILMDINMPLINGFETTRLIRKRNIDVPIIAITAFAKDEISEEAILCGINDILIKPFDPEKLFKTIKNQIQKKILYET